ncbi:exocyst complex component EXO70E2 [Cucurbita maxima]|uniref:Exocyst subunit Exo70 family protein n=1 Tax=Cucurbita maxima TaxID=3661 RepID=A0A6J1KFP2_CUCMA|nr:exocyst complex component EXO70E2 [Cucurbita maxima]XP_022998038.1 exocyst complex component EXO70E2 [Cucurbita maxima]
MGDCEFMGSDLGVEERLIAAANCIIKALSSNISLSDDTKSVMVDLCSKLSLITTQNHQIGVTKERDVGLVEEIESRLNVVQKKIMGWEADQSMIWDSAFPNDACEYLNAADDAWELVGKLESLCFEDEHGYELSRKAHDVLQTAMARLEEEFRHLLAKSSLEYEPESVSSHVTEDSVEEGSTSLYRDESFESSVRSCSVGRTLENSIIDLVNSDAVIELRGIANVMFKAGYDQECIQAYNHLRREALNECLSMLEMEKMSIEDVLKMDWVTLNSKIRKWNRAMKRFVRVYLASEKFLCDQVFGDEGLVSLSCFVESSKASMLQLLNFGEAMAIGPHPPEKLNRILEMYEVVGEHLSDIDTLYCGGVGYFVRIEYHDVLNSLGKSVTATFLEFGKAIAANTSPNAFAGGGIHHLTKYVMNYLLILTDYGNSLNVLLGDGEDVYPNSPSSSENPSREEEKEGEFSPMARHFRLVATILESNLEEKSKQYKDPALQHFFLMNNIHYMAQKVRGSELSQIFGEDWVRKRYMNFQQHVLNYKRASWNSIVLYLMEDGVQHPGSNSVSRNVLKERLRSFNVAFEEIYKTQTSWIIHDSRLRDDLRISTSLQVIPAYRAFFGRCNNHVSDKLIKYTPDDLEGFLLDLFEGSPKSLANTNRR